jgi:hypothetical protein
LSLQQTTQGQKMRERDLVLVVNEDSVWLDSHFVGEVCVDQFTLTESRHLHKKTDMSKERRGERQKPVAQQPRGDDKSCLPSQREHYSEGNSERARVVGRDLPHAQQQEGVISCLPGFLAHGLQSPMGDVHAEK